MAIDPDSARPIDSGRIGVDTLSVKAIRGFKDILPDEAVWWRRAEETVEIRKVPTGRGI